VVAMSACSSKSDQFREQRPPLRAARPGAGIAISAESGSGKAVLRVQDNGIGIPPDQIGACS